MKLAHILEDVIDFQTAKSKLERQRQSKEHSEQTDNTPDWILDYLQRPPSVVIAKYNTKPMIRPIKRFSRKWESEFVEQLKRFVSVYTAKLIDESNPNWIKVSWANREDGNRWLGIQVYSRYVTDQFKDMDKRLVDRIGKIFKKDVMQAAGRVLGWYVKDVDYGGIIKEPYFLIGRSWKSTLTEARYAGVHPIVTEIKQALENDEPVDIVIEDRKKGSEAIRGIVKSFGEPSYVEDDEGMYKTMVWNLPHKRLQVIIQDDRTIIELFYFSATKKSGLKMMKATDSKLQRMRRRQAR